MVIAQEPSTRQTTQPSSLKLSKRSYGVCLHAPTKESEKTKSTTPFFLFFICQIISCRTKKTYKAVSLLRLQPGSYSLFFKLANLAFGVCFLERSSCVDMHRQVSLWNQMEKTVPAGSLVPPLEIPKASPSRAPSATKRSCCDPCSQHGFPYSLCLTGFQQKKSLINTTEHNNC